MSIRDITHSNNLGLSVLAKSNAPTNAGGIAASGHTNVNASAFSALLTSAREIKGVGSITTKSPQTIHAEALMAAKARAAQHAESTGAHGAQFAALLGQAQEQYAPGATSAAQTLLSGQSHALTTLANNLTYEDLKGRISALENATRSASGTANEDVSGAESLDSARAKASYLATEAALVLNTIKAAQPYHLGATSPTANPDEVVDLTDKRLDFSPLLPSGLRSLMSDLKCPQSELDAFVNVMVFGREDGPHGQNAAQVLGADSLTGAELSAQLTPLMERAQINAPSLQAQDYNYVLRDPQASLGQTVAVSEQGDLDERVLERELDSTFQRDMALMQILARANNQSATIF